MFGLGVTEGQSLCVTLVRFSLAMDDMCTAPKALRRGLGLLSGQEAALFCSVQSHENAERVPGLAPC